MLQRKQFIALAALLAPKPSFAAGVDVIVIIPLYVILLVLSGVAFSRIEVPVKSIVLVVLCGIVLAVNWVFSFYIYLDWLANYIDNLGVALVCAALSPFLITFLVNAFMRRIG